MPEATTFEALIRRVRAWDQEAAAELAFQLPQFEADRRLCAVERFGGAREALQFRGQYERSHRAQVEGFVGINHTKYQ